MLTNWTLLKQTKKPPYWSTYAFEINFIQFQWLQLSAIPSPICTYEIEWLYRGGVEERPGYVSPPPSLLEDIPPELQVSFQDF